MEPFPKSEALSAVVPHTPPAATVSTISAETVLVVCLLAMTKVDLQIRLIDNGLPLE